MGLTIGILEEAGLCVLVGFTALETALGKVLTGAGRAIGWLEVGIGLLETGVLGVGIVVPILGVVTVGLETGLLETGVLAACGVA
jgi:hypothetical protein